MTLALFAAGESPAFAQPARPCPRAPAAHFAPGATVRISPNAGGPCRLVATATSVELRADASGVVADINGVYRAPDGRFYSVAWSAAEMAVWSESGQFLSPLGREGRGPGEFARGGKSMHFDGRGRLYVRDNNMRWSIFSPQQQFLGTLAAAGMGYDNKRATFVGNTFITGEPLSGRADAYFHAYEFALGASADSAAPPNSVPGGPRHVRSFGEVPERERTLPYESRERLITAAGASTFWAGPATGHGYEIEKWSVDGTRLLTLVRDVPWLAPGDKGAPSGVARSAAPAPSVVGLHDNGQGLLFVAVFVPNSRWQSIPPGLKIAARDSMMDKIADSYLDVIDTQAGVLFASVGPIPRSRLLGVVGDGFISGTDLGYKTGLASDGVPSARIIQYQLLSKQ